MVRSIEMKNWFNLEDHPTDEYIHWSEKNVKDVAINLRMYYNNIANAGFKGELDFLMKQAYYTGRLDESDDVSTE